MATLGFLTVRVKAWFSFQVVVSYVCAVFDDYYSTKAPASSVFDGSLAGNSCPEPSRTTLSSLWASQIALVMAQCSFCARSRDLLLRSLARPSWHFEPVRALAFEIARSTLSSLWARQIVQPSRHFRHVRSCNPLGTLGVSDRLRPGAVRILSRHFRRVRSLALWRVAHSDDQGDLAQRS